jgi:hypothetical protein
MTLRLIEQHPHRDEDAPLAMELKSALERYIAELECEGASTVRSPVSFANRVEKNRQDATGRRLVAARIAKRPAASDRPVRTPCVMSRFAASSPPTHSGGGDYAKD